MHGVTNPRDSEEVLIDLLGEVSGACPFDHLDDIGRRGVWTAGFLGHIHVLLLGWMA
jgi:hypothetical protein